MTESQRQIARIRAIQEHAPKMASQFAKHIFEDILQGDDICGVADDLMAECESGEQFEEDDVEVMEALMNHYLETLWWNILSQLNVLVRENIDTPPSDPRRQVHSD